MLIAEALPLRTPVFMSADPNKCSGFSFVGVSLVLLLHLLTLPGFRDSDANKHAVGSIQSSLKKLLNPTVLYSVRQLSIIMRTTCSVRPAGSYSMLPGYILKGILRIWPSMAK